MLLTIGALMVASTVVVAVPSAQVTLSATFARDYFYQDSAFTQATPAGWYLEVILAASNGAYDTSKFADYTVIGETFGSYPAALSYHQTGKLADGTAALSTGRGAISWTFSTTTYDNYYATFRFYNDADKAKATKYGILPTWKQVTLDPADPAPSQQSLGFTTAADRAYTKYDVPAVPEPTTMALFGLSGLGLFLRRKMRKEA